MEQKENMVQQDESFESEDLLVEDFVEEPQEESLSLEEALTETETEQTEDKKSQSAGERKEPGYVQTRINKAVEKAVAAVRGEYEAKLAPLMEHMLLTEAQDLVRTGKVKDLETAKELVRYRNGQPAPAAEEDQQPRNERGQFVERDSATKARISMLQHQADKIKGQRGIDVISEFQTNEETRRKVVTGEWDFYDVADMLSQQSSRKRAPAPMRSPNGASSNVRAIDFGSMSSEQFAKLEKKIQEGARISLK